MARTAAAGRATGTRRTRAYGEHAARVRALVRTCASRRFCARGSIRHASSEALQGGSPEGYGIKRFLEGGVRGQKAHRRRAGRGGGGASE